jgi:hypothetical protein
MSVRPSAKDEQQLMADLWSLDIKENPLKFVMYAFPWGVKGTPLEGHPSPRKWQLDELNAIVAHIKMNKIRMKNNKTPIVYQSATASGRGIGKSALVAWLDLWMMSCHIGSTCTITANTESQLKSKTWAELGKWHTLSINSHWFDRTALSLRPALWFEEALKSQLKIDTGYYYSQAILWSEENPDAFAGTHNFYGQLLIFDEASGIPAPIWKVSEGFFTEPILHRYWFCFSNPRRNTGEFFECFHKFRDYWKTRNVDSRSVEGVDKDQLQSIVNKFGEDSDEAKVEVKGLFPNQGDKQFISRSVIQGAISRELIQDEHAALYMGVDIARFGSDSTVICFRRGRDAKSIPAIKVKGKDNMEVANLCAGLIQQYNPDAVCIDAGGGTGVIDRLKEMRFKVYEVQFGSSAEGNQWANKRIEMWARMRDWLSSGCIEDDNYLISDLAGPEYKFKGHGDQMILESKEEMKKRGLASPDYADALAVTFFVKVARSDVKSYRNNKVGRVAKDIDYKIFG